MLRDIEHRYEQMLAAKLRAEREAQFTQPLGPNRAARRHPSGPSWIVRP